MGSKAKAEKDCRESRISSQKQIILPKIYSAGGDPAKKWHVYYSFRDPASGKMKRFRPEVGINKYETYYEKMEEAKKVQRKYYERLKNGWSPFDNSEVIYKDVLEYKATADLYGRLKKGRQKLLKLISDFLEEKKPPVSKKKTFQTYQSKFRIFGKWLRDNKLDNIHPALFTEEHASSFFKFVLERRQAAPATYNKYRSVLLTFFDFARSRRKMKINPIANIKAIPEHENVPRSYNENMVRVITKHLEQHDKQMLLVVKFIYYTFIRPGELRLMKIKDLNFWDGTVIIRKDISKNRKEQKVTIPDVFLEELIDLEWNQYDREYYLFSKDRRPSDRPVGANYFSRYYRKYMNELNISEDYELYSWKHTGVAEVLKQGVDLESLRLQIRHHDLKDTQRYAKAIANSTSVFKSIHKKI